MNETELRSRHFSRVEYEQLIERGIFKPDERLELIGGLLVVRDPQRATHAFGAELAAAKEVECVALDARDLHAKRAQAAEAKARDEWAARNEAEKRASEYKAQKEAAEKELADLKEGQHMNCVHRHRLEDVEAKLARTLSDNKFLKMCPAFDEKVPCGTCLSCLSRKLAQAERDHIVRINEMVEQRDEALTKWHAHQKNVPCAGCEGGHDTFWKTVVESPQWKAWTTSGPEWDVDECQECGHISQAHFQAFMAFAGKPLLAVVEAARNVMQKFKKSATGRYFDCAEGLDPDAECPVKMGEAGLEVLDAALKALDGETK